MQEFVKISSCTLPFDAFEKVPQVKLAAFHQLPALTLACLQASAEWFRAQFVHIFIKLC